MDLTERLQQFKELEYDFNKEKYLQMKDGQSPHTLFISCSDSRIDAERLLQAEPGEIFQIRNVANIVPRKAEPVQHPGIISAIEYAIKALGVKNIVICGHSNCGGCNALMHLEDYQEKFPYTSKWIAHSQAIYEYIKSKYAHKTEEEQTVLLEQFNTIQQLDNLMTYPFIRQAYNDGSINLFAYYYEIGSGTVSVYEYDDEYTDLLNFIDENRAEA